VTLKDKLEIGLKEDAPYRKDNLPEHEVRGPQIPAGPGRSPEVPAARKSASTKTARRPTSRAARQKTRKPAARSKGR
jgi:hypothetical protein